MITSEQCEEVAFGESLAELLRYSRVDVHAIPTI
jgi:hypothetical protein